MHFRSKSQSTIIPEPLIDEEGIVYANIDLSRCIEPKQYHDILGHYNRFDIFKLEVDRTPLEPVHFRGDASANNPQAVFEAGRDELDDHSGAIVRLRAPQR